jgi:hypothetical protein
MTIKEIVDDWFKRFYDKDMTMKDIYLAGFREGLRCENPYGGQTNTNHGCVLPKYKNNKWKKAIRHPDNSGINITVQNKVPNTTVEIYRDTKNNNLGKTIDIIVSEFTRKDMEDKNGSKGN